MRLWGFRCPIGGPLILHWVSKLSIGFRRSVALGCQAVSVGLRVLENIACCLHSVHPSDLTWLLSTILTQFNWYQFITSKHRSNFLEIFSYLFFFPINLFWTTSFSMYCLWAFLRSLKAAKKNMQQKIVFNHV